MEKILITGATGFLGRNILEKIDYEKYEVWITGRNGPAAWNAPVHYVRADLLDTAEMTASLRTIRPQVLLMLAWNVGIADYWESADNLLWSDCSIKMAQIFLECGGRQIIFAGTSASYNYKLGYLKEQSGYEEPASLYGITKLYTSKILKRMADRNGAVYCEARIFSIYGKYERPNRLIPHTIMQLRHDKVIRNVKWGLFRDYIYVGDAADAILLLLEAEKDGVYNISSGVPVSIGKIIETIAKKMEKEDLILFDPLDIREDDRLIVGSNEKLLQCGFQCRYNLAEGLTQAIKDITF